MEDVDAPVIANVDRAWQLYHLLLSDSIKIKDILGNVEFAELEHSIKEEKKRVSKFPTGYSIWTYKYNEYTCIYQDRENQPRQMHLYAVKEMLPFFAANQKQDTI